MLIINGTITGVAALIVGLRVVSRVFIVKMVGVDDWIMVAAMIFAIVNVVIAGLGTLAAPYMTIPSLIYDK